MLPNRKEYLMKGKPLNLSDGKNTICYGKNHGLDRGAYLMDKGGNKGKPVYYGNAKGKGNFANSTFTEGMLLSLCLK